MGRHRRRVTLGIALVLAGVALAGCTTSNSSNEATEARFAEVVAGEDWNAVAARVTGCDGTEDIEAFAEYLRDSNPIVGDVGLGAGQVVAFDSDRADVDGCSLVSSDSDTQAVSDAADEPADEPDSEPAAGSADEAEDLEALVSEEPEPQPDADAASDQSQIDVTNRSTLFEEDFVDPNAMERFRWQIHHKPSFNGTPQTWQGDHDLDCAAPPSLRTINVPEEGNDPGETAYICAPGGPETSHLMTTFRSTGYAQVAFSPDEVFDGVTVVCWDQNETDLGSRKWTQLIVVDEATFQANDERLDYVKPGLEDGPGKSGVFLTDGVFLLVHQTGSTVAHMGQDTTDENFRGFTNEDKKRRYRICIEDLEDGTVRIELERDTETEVRILQGAFPDGAARVIFQDDTYNSTKSKSPVEEPFTWHWDNLLIAS